MNADQEYFKLKKEKAMSLFGAQKTIRNPYFGTDIVLNSDGFHHLQFSSRRERNKKEQLLRFSLLPLAFETIRKSGTVQEYRKILSPVGNKSAKNGFISMKEVEYWGLIAILGSKKMKVRTVLRRIGNGNITFWSVMPFSKIKKGKQRLYTDNIEDED